MVVPASRGEESARPPAWSGPERLEVESCSVSRWRGYVSSSFVALLEDGTPVAETGGFRWRGDAPPPDAGPARRAYDQLHAKLETLGWEGTAEEANPWYAGRFTRTVAVPVESSAAEARQETPEPEALEHAVVAEPERNRVREAPLPLPAPARALPAVEADPSPETPRRSRTITIVSVLGIVVALAVAAYLLSSDAGRPHAPVQQPTSRVSVARPAHKASVPVRVPAAQPRAAKVRLDITANGRASWVEVRRGSATGPVLFTGELTPERALHVSGTRLWARFGAARNVTIRADRKLVELTGTIEHVFAPATR
jgi:hypothetical protein